MVFIFFHLSLNIFQSFPSLKVPRSLSVVFKQLSYPGIANRFGTVKLERAVGKNEKLESFKLESFKLESLKLESLAEVGKSQAKLERTD